MGELATDLVQPTRAITFTARRFHTGNPSAPKKSQVTTDTSNLHPPKVGNKLIPHPPPPHDAGRSSRGQRLGSSRSQPLLRHSGCIRIGAAIRTAASAQPLIPPYVVFEYAEADGRDSKPHHSTRDGLKHQHPDASGNVHRYAGLPSMRTRATLPAYSLGGGDCRSTGPWLGLKASAAVPGSGATTYIITTMSVSTRCFGQHVASRDTSMLMLTDVDRIQTPLPAPKPRSLSGPNTWPRCWRAARAALGAPPDPMRPHVGRPPA